jgi:thiamine-monophosphate kinase
MPDDPDESFIVDTLLEARPEGPPRGSTSAPFAPGDDAAVVEFDRCVTVDAMIEGVHWDDALSAEDVGWKLAAVNASDINAMGAVPRWAVLTIAVPTPLDKSWIRGFSRGFGAALAEWNIQLVGGDTARSPGPRMLSLTLTGEAQNPIGRDGAQPGDDIWVSGPLGGAAAGFLLNGASTEALRRPHPPMGLGPGLVGIASAMMDLSDGLARDLPRLCTASGVGAEVEPTALPLHPNLDQAEDPLPLAVGFGEEYELLFTAPPAHRDAIRQMAAQHNRDPSRIGIINEASGATLVGMQWPALAFSHFGGAPC